MPFLNHEFNEIQICLGASINKDRMLAKDLKPAQLVSQIDADMSFDGVAIEHVPNDLDIRSSDFRPGRLNARVRDVNTVALCRIPSVL